MIENDHENPHRVDYGMKGTRPLHVLVKIGKYYVEERERIEAWNVEFDRLKIDQAEIDAFPKVLKDPISYIELPD